MLAKAKEASSQFGELKVAQALSIPFTPSRWLHRIAMGPAVPLHGIMQRGDESTNGALLAAVNIQTHLFVVGILFSFTSSSA